jgi:hypothetical protein
MKTLDEIQAEAHQLTVLGKQYQREHSGAAEPLGIAPPPLELMRYPLTPMQALGAASPDEAPALQRQRSIDVVMRDDDIVYRLVEREEPGWLQLENTPFVVMVADSAFNALRTGYELAEEEGLIERHAPYPEGEPAGEAGADSSPVAEEEALETELLRPSGGQDTGAEIGVFLDGRLEPNDRIERPVLRQDHRETPTEHESLGIRHRITVGDP